MGIRRWAVAVSLLIVATIVTEARPARGAPSPGGSAGQVDQLIQDLDSKAMKTRISAAKALAELGKKASRAVKPLIRCLADRHEPLREAAAAALASIGGVAYAQTRKACESTDENTRSGALLALGGMKRSSAVKIIEEALSDSSRSVRLAAVEALGLTGASSAVSKLLPLLKDKDRGICFRALKSLGSLGTRAGRAAGEVEAFCKAGDPGHRVQAAYSHWQITGRREPAVPTLRALLTDKSETIRTVAIGVLGKIGGEDATVALAEVLFRDRALAEMALLALSEVGAPALLPVLRVYGTLRPAPPLNRALDAVVWIGNSSTPEALGRELVRALKEENSRTADAAELLFSREHAKAVMTLLIETLDDESPRVRRRALDVLAGLGPDARSARARIEGLLEDPDPTVRKSAAEALKKIAPE